MLDKITLLGEKIIKYIALLPLVAIAVLCLIFQNSISMDILETSTIRKNGLVFIILMILAVLIFVVGSRILKYVPESLIFIVLALSYLIVGIYLITHIQMVLRYDSGICYWNALCYVEGDFTGLQQGEYFYEYPQQLGLVLYNSLLVLISKDENFVYYVNLFWIIVGNFFLWRTTVLVYKEHVMARKMTMVFSFLFFPQLLYLFFAYGQVPGLGCLLIAIYLGVRYLEKHEKWSLLVSLLFVGVSCLVRMNYVIAGIALMIIVLREGLMKKKMIYGLVMLCLLVAMLLPRALVNGYYEQVAATDLSNGMPATLHIAMGLQENEEPWRANGWYNGYNDNTYKENGCDPAASGNVAKEEIKNRLKYMLENPAYGACFFKEKLITTWCEPTFQSVWSGPLISMKCATETEWLNDFYSGGLLFQRFAKLMNIVNVMIFGFSAFYIMWNLLVEKDPLDVLSLFGIVYFLGGFLFHCFWETKCQYVYPYVVCLVPVAAKGIYMIIKRMRGRRVRNVVSN